MNSLVRKSWLPISAGVVTALSPHTGADRLFAGVFGGLVVAGGILSWQWHREPRDVAPPLLEGVSWIHGAVLALWLLVFSPTLAFLYAEWTDGIWQNGHGILLPLLLLLLAIRILRRNAEQPAESSTPAGLGLILIGLTLVAIDAGLNLGYLATLGLLLSLPGLSLVFLGPESTRKLVPVFLLSLFVLPVPTSAAHVLGLPKSVAGLAEYFIGWVGIPVSREGVLLFMPDEFFAVSDRCSGISAFFGGMFVATFVALYTQSTWRRCLALLAPWPLTAAFSGLRVALLVGVAETTDLAVMESATHGISGIAVFWMVVIPIALLVDHREVRTRLG